MENLTVAQKKEIHANVEKMMDFFHVRQNWKGYEKVSYMNSLKKELKRLEARKHKSASWQYRLDLVKSVFVGIEGKQL